MVESCIMNGEVRREDVGIIIYGGIAEGDIDEAVNFRKYLQRHKFMHKDK